MIQIGEQLGSEMEIVQVGGEVVVCKRVEVLQLGVFPSVVSVLFDGKRKHCRTLDPEAF
jgi:hypothetical protein